MEKKMVKAVRMVNGFTDDLRVKLDRKPQQEAVRKFLEENILGIYGTNVYEKVGVTFNPQPGKDARDYYKLICFLDKEALKICAGEYDSEK